MQRKTVKKRLILKKNIKNFINKLLITIIIFLIGLISIKENPSLKIKINENIYQDSFKFINNNKIYKKYFGNILSLDKMTTKTESVFNEKITYQTSKKYQNGVELTVTNNYMVPILETGIVLYIGEKENYGQTIIIEQIDGIEVYYSNINSNVKLYDYVEKGKLLGEAKSNKIYLTFQKDGKYLDYKKYI